MGDLPSGDCSASSDRDLQELGLHWGSAYEFTRTKAGYRAIRRDTGRLLTSRSAAWLWELVLADHLASPIPGQQ